MPSLRLCAKILKLKNQQCLNIAIIIYKFDTFIIKMHKTIYTLIYRQFF